MTQLEPGNLFLNEDLYDSYFKVSPFFCCSSSFLRKLTGDKRKRDESTVKSELSPRKRRKWDLELVKNGLSPEQTLLLKSIVCKITTLLHSTSLTRHVLSEHLCQDSSGTYDPVLKMQLFMKVGNNISMFNLALRSMEVDNIIQKATQRRYILAQ